jgi:Peroxidase, family 2
MQLSLLLVGATAVSAGFVDVSRLSTSDILSAAEGAGSAPPPVQPGTTVGSVAYSPPGATDSRSPCPALNALANHNYL